MCQPIELHSLRTIIEDLRSERWAVDLLLRIEAERNAHLLVQRLALRH
jgi:hypothetical protein